MSKADGEQTPPSSPSSSARSPHSSQRQPSHIYRRPATGRQHFSVEDQPLLSPIEPEPEDYRQRIPVDNLTDNYTQKLTAHSTQQNPYHSPRSTARRARDLYGAADSASKVTDSFTIEMQDTSSLNGNINAADRARQRRNLAAAQGLQYRSFWDRLFNRKQPKISRTFNISAAPKHVASSPQYPPNIVRNQKYHLSSFLFIVLYNQVRCGQFCVPLTFVV